MTYKILISARPNRDVYLVADKVTDDHTASQRFGHDDSIATLAAWLETTCAPYDKYESSIHYSNDTNLIYVERAGVVKTFRPTDEDLSRLVRHLKTAAWTPTKKHQPTLPGIPEVSEKNYITRYVNPQAASGSGHRSVRKGQAKEASPEATEKMVLDALASLRKEIL